MLALRINLFYTVLNHLYFAKRKTEKGKSKIKVKGEKGLKRKSLRIKILSSVTFPHICELFSF